MSVMFLGRQRSFAWAKDRAVTIHTDDWLEGIVEKYSFGNCARARYVCRFPVLDPAPAPLSLVIIA